MPDTKKTLAYNLSRLRHAAGETQAELAAALHVSPAAVSEWEQARKLPRLDTLTALAEHYGVARDTLFADPDAPPTDLDELLHGSAPLALAGRLLTDTERRLIARLARAVLV